MTISRNLQRQVNRLADLTADRIGDTQAWKVVATVSAVSAGGSRDGQALVSVRWRGQEVTVAGYAASYTPAVGHRVACDVIDHQLLIAYRIVGYP